MVSAWPVGDDQRRTAVRITVEIRCGLEQRPARRWREELNQSGAAVVCPHALAVRVAEFVALSMKSAVFFKTSSLLVSLKTSWRACG
jgi:hypothetical protein